MQVAQVVVAERLTPKKLFFDYIVPTELKVVEGTVVFVPWRSGRTWGVVKSLLTVNDSRPLKSVLSVVPVSPISVEDRRAIFFLASHYHVSPGFILRSFFPPPPQRGLVAKPFKKNRQEKLNLSVNSKIYWLRDNQPTNVFTRQYIKKSRRPLALFFPLIREQETAEKYLKLRHHKINFWQLREQLLSGQERGILSLTRRSAFLPPPNYGIVVVHAERREYVQFDMNPRYALEEVLRVRGFSPDLLVEAPRFSDWYHAEQKYVSLLQSGSPNSPEIVTLNPKDFSFFSDTLKERIIDTLQNNKKVVLFHWQTGEARELSCRHCFWQAECSQCLRPQILTTSTTLRCPACLNEQSVPQFCSKCSAIDLRQRRLGLSGWRKRLAKTFPVIQDARLEIHTIPELPFDTDNLGLVAILSADALWRHPQFDTAWQAWQALTQVQRLAEQHHAQLLIQTHTPGHAVLQAIRLGKPNQLYLQEKTEREQFHLPPFGTYLRLRPGPRAKIKILSEETVQAIKKIDGRYYPEDKNYLVFLPTTDETSISKILALLPVDWHLDRYPFL